ncbi:hypothetical protein FACS1894205_3040 [Alphaproteobacteria bacterium]|nr:hypothetical protein FACS1894205_3040 [Alphaproteobacteria bacterium]
MSDKPVILVSATRKTAGEFQLSPLGRSLLRVSSLVIPAVVTENRQGLPVVYNRFITEATRNAYLVFIHDDVWIDDAFMPEHLQFALSRFDIVGVAGNTRLFPNSGSWHQNEQSVVTRDSLSGGIAYGAEPFGPFTHYGPTPAAVQLLDGVFIAARGDSLLERNVRFDEQFDFHFYDLDFSRTANAADLKVGTWPIALTHLSAGKSGFSEKWEINFARYRNKWSSPTNPS